MALTVYILCILTSLLCAVLLLRKYFRTGTKFLFWSGACFIGLALNNIVLVTDLVIFPTQFDLMPLRGVLSVGSLGVLLYGFIWEVQ